MEAGEESPHCSSREGLPMCCSIFFGAEGVLGFELRVSHLLGRQAL
jgi:hypothetical protein